MPRALHPVLLSLALVALAQGCGGPADPGAEAGTLTAHVDANPPEVSRGRIRHVVVLMMENRSFDHFLGWVPGADGRQAGLQYPDRTGARHATFPLAPDYQGCAYGDPDHSYQGGRVERDNGRDDGWLFANDLYSIGYYRAADLDFWRQAVPLWTTFDRYFPSILSETFPNRIYQHAGQTDRISNTFEPSHLPTIWDRLAAKGLKGRYYYSDLPFLGLWGAKYVGISEPIQRFYQDAAEGQLPEVAFVDGQFAQEALGTGNDDHPHGDIRNGEKLIASVYNAVTQSPQWKDTVLFVNFDEWGGFFDHVDPPRGPLSAATRAAGDHDGRLGFRVPALLVAPWAAKREVSHDTYEHTSVLRMIEWNWGLPPLAVRDASARNLANELDLDRPRGRPQPIEVPQGPFGTPCASEGPGNGVAEEATALAGLRALAQQSGFKLP